MASFGANPFLLFFSLQTVGKPFSIQDNQLIQHLIPVPISLCPFPDYVFAGKIQHLFQCCMRGISEMHSSVQTIRTCKKIFTKQQSIWEHFSEICF